MKSFLKSCTAIALAVSFSGQAVAQEMLQSLGAGEGEVSIIAWAGYIERGETDKAFDWVTDFEKNTGCKVSVKTAATSDEMVALMNEGGFDLVTASGDSSLRLVAGKRVQPINTALIPSWSTIDERLQNAPWHTVDGVHYGTPYVWGANVLMYNTNVFKEAPKSWNVVFEETTLGDGKSNKGRVQAYDGPIHVADAANYLMFHKPELGIKDPYELTEDQYKAALDLLSGPAFERAFARSTNPDDWRWGKLHRITFDALLGGAASIPGAGTPQFPASVPGLPGLAVDGGFGVVDASSHNVRAAADDHFTFGSGPNRRYVGSPGWRPGTIDAQSILPGGNSGRVGSAFYANMLGRWLTNDTYSFRTDIGEVVRDLASVEVFRPGR